MEKKLTEEKITLNIIAWLKANSWRIVCFDFPQSGTGKAIYSDTSIYPDCERLIPDIIAVRNKVIMVFENKDRFYQPDFDKVCKMKTTKAYEKAILSVAKSNEDFAILYGIGGPDKHSFIEKAVAQRSCTDFIIVSNGTCCHEV